MNNFIFIIFLILVIMVLLSVAFLTLLEQKLLSYIQIRKGPNKVGFMGLFQPFCDAIKLFFKELTTPIYSNFNIYFFCPVLLLLLSLIIWLVFPFIFYVLSFNLSFLFMVSCMSVGVYMVMFSGWSSNSNYSLLGSLRSVAQTISYEVCMILFLLCYIFFVLSLNLMQFFFFQEFISLVVSNILICFIMLIIFLAETNRSPFDFAEGESELVSGFNTEYSSGMFAMIFLSEYSMILFLSVIIILFFFFNSFIFYFLFLKIMLISFLFIWIRSAFPRYRYDKLMYLNWKLYLPISLMMMIFYFLFSMVLF